MNGVEILVHNLSHSDLVLTINNNELSVPVDSIIARPKFSFFREISERIYQKVKNDETSSAVSLSPLFSRTKKQYLTDEQIPVGFKLKDAKIIIDRLNTLRFRHDDLNVLLDKTNDNKNQINKDLQKTSEYVIESAFFPLVGVLLPKWLKTIEKGKEGVKKIIVLVSGRGTPNNENAKMSDNSTKYTAKLIYLFIKREYPDLTVLMLHSKTNLFRYDENIIFVKHELLPLIEKQRNELVGSMGGKWKENMRITLSFADGSSARISAINASLRHYRPFYMHFWQLKSFWREKKFCEEDIEYHSFEEIATEPAVSLQDTSDPLVKMVVHEMQKFREEFNSILKRHNDPNDGFLHDLQGFWLRKTKKPVLSVLLVQKPNEPPILYRGTNMEVSMPTGSLCAERNVIGTALSNDMSLRRQDLKLIAVYSATMENSNISNNLNNSEESIMNSQVSYYENNNYIQQISSTEKNTLKNDNFDNAELPELSENIDMSPFNPAQCSSGESPLGKSPSVGVKRKIMNIPLSTRGAGGTFFEEGTGLKKFESFEETSEFDHFYKKPVLNHSYMGNDSEANEMNENNGFSAVPSFDGTSSNGLKVDCDTGLNSPIFQEKGSSPVLPSFPLIVNPTEDSTEKLKKTENPDNRNIHFSTENQFETLKKEKNSNQRIIRSGSSDRLKNKFVPFSSPYILQPSSPDPRTDLSPESTSSGVGASPTTSTKKLKNPSSKKSKTRVHAGNCLLNGYNGFNGGKCTCEPGFLESPPSPPGVPMRGRGYSQGSDGYAPNALLFMPRVTTITVDESDMNPLKPCGSCNEWLKKIAEVNPHFKVITFTDAHCHGVYVEEIAE